MSTSGLHRSWWLGHRMRWGEEDLVKAIGELTVEGRRRCVQTQIDLRAGDEGRYGQMRDVWHYMEQNILEGCNSSIFPSRSDFDTNNNQDRTQETATDAILVTSLRKIVPRKRLLATLATTAAVCFHSSLVLSIIHEHRTKENVH